MPSLSCHRKLNTNGVPTAMTSRLAARCLEEAEKIRVHGSLLKNRGLELETAGDLLCTLATRLETLVNMTFPNCDRAFDSSVINNFGSEWKNMILITCKNPILPRHECQILLDILQTVLIFTAILGAIKWGLTGTYSLFKLETESSTTLNQAAEVIETCFVMTA
jgi:hypothetical protein